MKEINHRFKIQEVDKKSLVSIDEALRMEKDLYTKCIITILKTTGMRNKELLELTTNCIHQDLSNGYTISWLDSKKPIYLWSDEDIHTMPINTECADVIKNLIETTNELREQADMSIKKYLFIHSVSGLRSDEIKQLTFQQIQKLLKCFSKHHGIRDNNGELLNISSNMIRKEILINTMKQSVVETTRFYTGIKDADLTISHAESYNCVIEDKY
jgi:site-specific recombinase XerD